MNTYDGGMDVQIHIFMTSALVEGEWLALRMNSSGIKRTTFGLVA
jgi:hypothetical protein